MLVPLEVWLLTITLNDRVENIPASREADPSAVEEAEGAGSADVPHADKRPTPTKQKASAAVIVLNFDIVGPLGLVVFHHVLSVEKMLPVIPEIHFM